MARISLVHTPPSAFQRADIYHTSVERHQQLEGIIFHVIHVAFFPEYIDPAKGIPFRLLELDIPGVSKPVRQGGESERHRRGPPAVEEEEEEVEELDEMSCHPNVGRHPDVPPCTQIIGTTGTCSGPWMCQHLSCGLSFRCAAAGGGARKDAMGRLSGSWRDMTILEAGPRTQRHRAEPLGHAVLQVAVLCEHVAKPRQAYCRQCVQRPPSTMLSAKDRTHKASALSSRCAGGGVRKDAMVRLSGSWREMTLLGGEEEGKKKHIYSAIFGASPHPVR